MSRAGLRAVLAAGVLLGSGCASGCKRGSGEADAQPRVALGPVEATDEAGLTALLWPPQGVQAHVPLSADERDALQHAVADLVAVRDFEDPALPVIAGRANEAGFELRRFTVEGRPLAALLDRKARGAGAYMVWLDAAATGPAVVLQAPHSFFDTHTGTLALRGFLGIQEPPAALFVNTLHRYVGVDGKRDKRARDENPSDPAHNTEHAFAAATTAAAKAYAPRKVTVVQLHGFGAKPEATADKGAMVVSAGRKQGSTRASTAVATALAELELGRVVRFPEQAERLGATTNVQRRALETVPNADFVHIEMSNDVRVGLADDPARLLRFTQALVRSLRGAP